jgi:2-dehydropantoate 2-reductase
LKKIAVIGIGAIGGILGGYLTEGGQDVTLIEPFWREHAEVMKKDGLTLKGPAGKQTIEVKVLFIDDLSQLKERIDILFISVKSNDTVKMLTLLKPYLAKDAWVISPQNGINEDVIIPIVGKANTIGCISYTGGVLLKPGYVMGHDGSFIIGEIDGQITPRIKELAQILSLVRPTEISANIMKERWIKLSQAVMVVPIAAISGLGLRETCQNQKAHRLCARIVSEVIQVARAAGYKLDIVTHIKADDWKKLARGPVPEASKTIAEVGTRFVPNATNATTNDIKQGQPLEIDYTNGYVISKGNELGVPTPVNEHIVSMVRAIESGKIKPSLDTLDELLKLMESK